MNLAEKNLLLAKRAQTLALSQFKTACESNMGVACIRLAQVYQGLNQIDLAEKFFKKSCSSVKSKFCGSKNKRADQPTMVMLAEACKSGVVISCLRYSENLFERKRTEQAKKILRGLCDKKESKGCSNLGLHYRDKKNYKKAQDLFSQACRLGSRISCRWNRALSKIIDQQSRGIATSK